MDKNSQDPESPSALDAARDAEEFARLMARAPSPEQERRNQERGEQARRALGGRLSVAQRARQRLNGVHAVVLSNGKIDTFRSSTTWGSDDEREQRGVGHRPIATLRGPRRRGAGRPRARRTSSSSRTSSADPGSDSDDGPGEPHDAHVAPERLAPRRAVGIPARVLRYVAANGLTSEKVRWCNRCAIVAPAIDAYERQALDRIGFHDRCPDCDL